MNEKDLPNHCFGSGDAEFGFGFRNSKEMGR